MKGSLNAKLDAQFFQERKRQIAFFGAGLAATVLIVFLYADAIRFLSRSVDTALDLKQSSSQPVQFDIENLRKLGLLRPEDAALLPPDPAAQPAQLMQPSGESAGAGIQDVKEAIPGMQLGGAAPPQSSPEAAIAPAGQPSAPDIAPAAAAESAQSVSGF